MNSKIYLPDIKSGSVVFLVALPLCLGISLACGVPLFSGIIAGVIGGSIVTLFSNSKYSVSGPAAGLTAIVISSIAQLGSLQVFLAAVVLAGIFQFIFGLVKAGGISNFIPNAVIKGMLAGIGIILIIKQLPHLVGYDADPEGDMYFDQPDGHNSISDLYYMLNYVTPGSIIIGSVALLVLLISERRFYKNNRLLSMLPGPVLAVISGVVLNLIFSDSAFLKIESQHLVNLPGIHSIEDFRKQLLHPDYSMIGSTTFWIVAITLAVIASLETLLSIEAIEKLDPEKQPVNSDRELMAQGIGNIISGLVGGLPVTSVIVRSSANINSGAKTKTSAIFHALLLLMSVLFFSQYLNMIPNSTLAVLLIFTGYKLTKISLFKSQFKAGFDQFLPFIVTIGVMLLTDLLKGVCAGIVVAVIFIIRNNVRSSFEIIEDKIEGRINYLIRLPQHITFFNKGFLINYLNAIKNESTVIIDGSINRSTDKDVREVMLTFLETSQQKNITIQLVKYII